MSCRASGKRSKVGCKKLKWALDQCWCVGKTVVSCPWPLGGGWDCQGTPWPIATPDLCFQLVVAEENHDGCSGL